MNKNKFLLKGPTDELENIRISNFLKVLMLLTIILLLILGITKILLPPYDSSLAYTLWSLAGINAVFYILFKKKNVHVAGLLFIITIWLAETILAWTNEGVRDIAIVTYIVCILIAVNISRYWHALIISLLSIISVWGLAYAEYNHIIVPKPDTSINYSLDYTVLLVIIITILFLHRNSYLLLYGRIQKELDEKLNTERSLRESEQKTRAFFDLSFGLIGLLNTEGIVLDVNRSALEFVGAEMSEVKGKPFWETPWWSHSPETQNQIREAITRAAKGELVREETTHIAKDGTLRSIDFTLKPVLDEKGQVSFIIPEGHDITANKIAVDILRESKERFRTLSSIASEGIMIHNNEIIIDTNLAFAKILGYSSPDDLIGKNALEFVPFTPESKEVVLDHFINNSDETFDIELVNLDGVIIPVETRGIEIVYMGSEARLVYMRDITDRKKAEEALRKNEAIQRKMVSNIGDVIVIIDKNGINHYKSPNITTLFGWKPEELIGKSTWDVVHPDDLDAIQKFIGELAMESGATGTTELRYRCKDGKYVWIEITLVNLLSDPDIKGLLGNYHNIANRKQADIDLKAAIKAADANSANVTAILEGTADSIWAFNRNFEILYINQVFQKEFHQTFGVWLEPGFNLIEALPEALRQFWEPRYKRVLANEQFTIEDAIDTGNGTLYIQVNFNPIVLNGQVIGGSCFGSNITHRKLSEIAILEAKQKAEESEEKFRSITEQTGDLIAITDTRGIITYASSASKTLFQFDPEEMCDRNFIEFFDEPEIPRALEVFSNEIKGNTGKRSLEFSLKRKDGSIFVGELNGSKFQQGLIYGILVVIRDITERKQAEEKISMLAHAVQSISECVSITDLTENIIFVNDAFLKTYKYEEQELLGKKLSIVHSPDNPEEVTKEILPATLRGGWQGELVSRTKDGADFPTFISTSPIVNENGKLNALIEITTDITQRKISEKLLRDSEERYRSLYENSIIGIYRTTPDGKVIMANPAIIKMLGYSSFEDFATRDLNKEGFAPSFGRDLFLQQIEMNGEVVGLESAWISKQGTIIYVRESAKIIFDSNGKILFFDGTVENITKRKLLEEKEKQHARDLAFLSRSSIELVNLPLEEDIFYLIGKQLRELIPGDSILALSEFDPAINVYHGRSIVGTEKIMGKIKKILGIDPMKMKGDFLPSVKNAIATGSFKKLENGIVDMTDAISKKAANLVMKIFGLKDVYVMGFIRDGSILGSITIIQRQIKELPEQSIIEAFGNQISLILQKRMAEESLQKSETLYRTLTETSQDLISILDRQGKIEYANLTAARIFKRSTEELIGLSMAELFPDTASRQKENVGKVFRNGEPLYVESSVSIGGQLFWLGSWLVPLSYEIKKVSSVMIVARDITERKKADEQLQYQIRLRELLMNMSATYISIPTESVESTIQSSLKELAETIDCDRIVICSYEVHEQTISVVYEWFQSGLESRIDDLQGIPVNSLPELHEHFRGESAHIPYTKSIPKGNLQRILEKGGSRVLLAVPLMMDGVYNGSVTVSKIKRCQPFSDDEMRIMEVFALMLVNIQKRRQAQVILQKSEEKFRELVENINDVFFTLDTNGIITYISPQVITMYNYQPHELIGHPFSEIIHPDDVEKVNQAFHENMANRPNPVEFMYSNRNGQIGWARTSARPIIENGRVSGVRGLFSDITERKLAEEKISMLAHSIQSISECVSITDLTDKIIYVNHAFLKTYQYEEDELVGNHIIMVRPAHYSKAEVEEILAATLQGGWKGEVINQRKDGSIFPVYVSTSVLKDDNGEPIAIVGVSSDITKRKQVEEELRKLSLAVEQSPASIVITNLKGEIEYVNPSFTLMTGYSLDEVIGKNPSILKSGHTSDEIYRDLWSKISSGHEWRGEFQNRKKNGEFFWEAASISPIINDKKEITHYLAVKEDITEKKESTRLIFDTIIETEERERQRYSHELHDGLGPILSTINLYFQMLAENTETDQKNVIVARAGNCIDEAIQTIKEISYNLSPSVLSSFGIISGIHNFINRLTETKKLNIVFDSNIERRFEKNIEITIYRIITELINNTIKYSGATATIVSLNFSETDHILTLEYMDNGCGFDMDEVMSSRKGLGMSNIFQRVNTLNGKINIETAPNKGIKVLIELRVLK